MITSNTPLSTVLELGKECDRSGRCCKNGSGIVLSEDVPELAKKFEMSEEKFIAKYLKEFENLNTKHYRLMQRKQEGRPHGPCVFLKGNDCSIHEIKPIHCKVSSCCSKQGEELSLWFMEKYFLNKKDPESVKQYESYKKLGGKSL